MLYASLRLPWYLICAFFINMWRYHFFFYLSQHFEVHINEIDSIFLPSCSCCPCDTQFVGHTLFFADFIHSIMHLFARMFSFFLPKDTRGMLWVNFTYHRKAINTATQHNFNIEVSQMTALTLRPSFDLC